MSQVSLKGKKGKIESNFHIIILLKENKIWGNHCFGKVSFMERWQAVR